MPHIMLLSFTLFVISRVLYFMVFITLLYPLWLFKLTLMLIDPMILLIISPLLVFVFFLEILLSLGKARNKVRWLVPTLKQNIMHLLIVLWRVESWPLEEKPNLSLRRDVMILWKCVRYYTNLWILKLDIVLSRVHNTRDIVHGNRDSCPPSMLALTHEHERPTHSSRALQ